MPRQARLDSPGTLHHVLIRGIERRRIVDGAGAAGVRCRGESRDCASIGGRLRSNNRRGSPAGRGLNICHFEEPGTKLFQLVNNVPYFVLISSDWLVEYGKFVKARLSKKAAKFFECHLGKRFNFRNV